MSIPSLFTFKRFPEVHDEISESGLRYLKFNEDQNGAKELQVFLKNGRRCYIDENRYYLRIELETTGELEAVIKVIRDAKEKGQYLSPEDAVAQIRGGVSK